MSVISMQIMRLTCAFLLLAAAGVAELQSTAVLVIDSTKPQDCAGNRPSRGSGGLIGSEGQQPAKPFPLALRLMNVNPHPLRWSGSVAYDIELLNEGKEPVSFPWATECDVRWDDPALVTVGVGLKIEGDPGNEPFAFVVIYGSKADERQMRRIAPGERVTVRVVGLLRGARAGGDIVRRLEAQPKINANVLVEMTLIRGGDRWRPYLPMRSVNAMAVDILRWDHSR